MDHIINEVGSKKYRGERTYPIKGRISINRPSTSQNRLPNINSQEHTFKSPMVDEVIVIEDDEDQQMETVSMQPWYNTSLLYGTEQNDEDLGPRSDIFNLYIPTILTFLEDSPLIRALIIDDVCNGIADNYLLAVAAIYLIRAFPHKDYRETDFFAALYLAHEMLEDPGCLSPQSLIQYVEKCPDYVNEKSLMNEKLHLFRKMNYRGHVSKWMCNEVFKIVPQNWAWQRVRHSSHGVTLRNMVPIGCTQCSYTLYIDNVHQEAEEQTNDVIRVDT